MKKLLLSAVCLVATGASAIELKPCVEGRLTNLFSESKFSWADEGVKGDYSDNKAIGSALAVGTQIGPAFRAEIEAFLNGDQGGSIKMGGETVASSSLESRGFFLNGYWDITTVNGFTPYIGAGIGYSWLENEQSNRGNIIYRFSGKDWGYNVGAGVAYSLTDNTAVTFGYRYEDLGKIKKEGSKTQFKAHKIALGLRYTF